MLPKEVEYNRVTSTFRGVDKSEAPRKSTLQVTSCAITTRPLLTPILKVLLAMYLEAGVRDSLSTTASINRSPYHNTIPSHTSSRNMNLGQSAHYEPLNSFLRASPWISPSWLVPRHSCYIRTTKYPPPLPSQCHSQHISQFGKTKGLLTVHFTQPCPHKVSEFTFHSIYNVPLHCRANEFVRHKQSLIGV